MQIKVNGAPRTITSDPSTPMLWVLRDELNLTGTKFGCGIAMCGACNVMVDGNVMRSCVMPVASFEGKNVLTVEGMSKDRSHPLQKAWIKHQVPQCGYCQSGFLIAAAGLLKQKPDPTDADIDTAITNLCRCGTYPAMRAAIKDAAAMIKAGASVMLAGETV
jgi:aerobic-type carbon monoxide dehydrogenase small subunit (CoxS/CutS family)